MKRRLVFLALAPLWTFSSAVAQESAPVPPAPPVELAVPAVTVPVAPQAAQPAPCDDCIPALTPVELVIDADLGSKISTTGAMFPLHLAKPIVIDGREVVAAGAEGQGEVIHAKKAGGSGASGELVLAARFITVDGRQLPLRSMRVALAGADAINAVDTINAASAASPLPIGLIGFAISGKNVVYPKGTVALAKTREAFPLLPPTPLEVPAAALPQPPVSVP